MRGMILQNNKTKGHGQWLSLRGYSVREGQCPSGKNTGKAVFLIEATKIVEGTYTLRDWDHLGAWLNEVVTRKCLLTYRTRLQVGGATYFGIPLCGILESRWKGTSALICTPDKGEGVIEAEYEVLGGRPAPSSPIFTLGVTTTPTPKEAKPLRRERLQELKELLDDGIITQCEYTTRRDLILGEI